MMQCANGEVVTSSEEIKSELRDTLENFFSIRSTYSGVRVKTLSRILMELYVRVTCRGQSLQSGAFRECGFDLVGATVVYEYDSYSMTETPGNQGVMALCVTPPNLKWKQRLNH
ncbi:unnamed protein product [Brassica rapa subsp. narinosa]